MHRRVPMPTTHEPPNELGSLIERAIFTSAQTDRAQGYQLVGRTADIDEPTARELTIWCPSHDGLIDRSESASSLNFHQLGKRRFCISRTIADGAEYSGRHGHRLTTHCLIVSAETMGCWANSPWALMNDALESGQMVISRPIPRYLKPFRLTERSPAFDGKLVKRLAERFGATRWAKLLEIAVSKKSVGFVGSERDSQTFEHVNDVIAGLHYCLPFECRSEFSFTSGLRFSPRRSFRWVTLEPNASRQRQVARQYGVTVVDLDDPSSLDRLIDGSAPRHGWAAFVAECIRRSNLLPLEVALQQRDPKLNLQSLSRHGDQLLRNMVASPRTVNGNGKRDPAAGEPKQADAAHDLSSKPIAQRRIGCRTLRPSRSIFPDEPEVVEKLETFDDTLYDAVAGDDVSLDRLRKLWRDLLDVLGEDRVEQSREYYLRHTLSVWNDFINQGAGGQERATAALDVVCLLSEE